MINNKRITRHFVAVFWGAALAALLGAMSVGLPAASVRAQAAPPAIPSFADVTPPPAPDYTQALAWATTGEAPGAAGLVAPGASPAAVDAPADVFFIYPTTSPARDRWNDDASDRRLNAWTDMSSLARQAAIFNGCCRIFTPRYRQATLVDVDGQRERALAVAYSDIERAFDYFLSHHSNGRPFIIAGHSQGGYMVAELLAKRINGTPLAERLVAAYGVGMIVTEGEAALRFPDVPICSTANQTGCFMQWNALVDGSDLAGFAARLAAVQAATHPERGNPTIVCTNPVSFSADRPATAASEARGAVPGDPGAGPLLPIVPGKVAAHCELGFLAVTFDPELGLEPLPGGVMHYHDMGLFYEDIRQNAIARVKAFIEHVAQGQ